MANEKQLMLQSLVFAMEDIRKKLDYSNKPETVKAYCECIEKIAVAYTYVARAVECAKTDGERIDGE